MNENVELVRKGFGILLNSLSGFIGMEMNKTCGKNWWDEVMISLSDQTNLLYKGEYSELIDQLLFQKSFAVIRACSTDF